MRWGIAVGLLLVTLFSSGPIAAALLDPPPIERPPAEGEEIPPSQDDVDPDQAARDLQKTVDDLTKDEGDQVAPSPGGTGGGDFVGGEVTQVLAENWMITAVITGGLLGALFAAWTLASRYIDPTVALRSPERSMLYGFIKGNPGVHLKQLSTEFTMKTSTVLWHVRKLEHADLVRSKKANGYRVFYPVSGGMDASRMSEAVTALANENARAIFLHIMDKPGEPVSGLTQQLQVNGGTLRWHVKKLRRAGLVEEIPDDARRSLRPTDLGIKAWTQVQGARPVAVPVAPSANPSPELEVSS